MIPPLGHTVPEGLVVVEGAHGAAWFGPEGEARSPYRYALHRNLNADALAGEVLLVVMLNPSTAGADANDPTITKLMTLARAWGFSNLWVVNLFAYRATDPRWIRALLREPGPMGIGSAPIGIHNDEVIRRHAARAQRIVCAWGSQPWAADRAEHVRELLEGLERRSLWALRLSKAGQPWHPLYLPNTTTPFLWERPR